MTGVHRLQHVQTFSPTNLAEDDTIRSHTERVFHKFTLGNLALSASALGGVYLAGGVTQRLIPWLKEKAALDRFYRRGPRTKMVSRVPIQVISSEAAPLMGAAHLWLDQKARGWL